MAQEKPKTYSLMIKVGNEEQILLKENLIEIDRFTTAFDNKFALIEQILNKMKEKPVETLIASEFYIKSSKGNTVPIIFSSFKNVTDDFENGDYINKLCSLATNHEDDSDVFIQNYFEDELQSKVSMGMKSEEDITKKMREYMQKDNIPIVNIVKTFYSIRKAESESGKDKLDKLDVDLSYNLRRFNKSYTDFRKLYTYVVGGGFFEQRVHQYDESDINKKLEEFAKIVENEFAFKQESFIPDDNSIFQEDNDEYEEDVDIDLDFIEHNQDPSYYPETIISSKTMTNEEKIDELNTYIDDPEERKYYVNKVSQG